MRPFQALYFCVKNYRKVLIVILMIMLTSLLYVGGSYLTNIEIECRKVSGAYRDFTFVFESDKDTDGSSLKQFLQDCGQDERLHVIPMECNHFRYPTTLGFQNGNDAWAFTPEDFPFINDRLLLGIDAARAKDNTLIVSEREATFLELTDGGTFEKNREEAIFYQGERPYQVAVTKKDCFFALLISEEVKDSNSFMVSFEREEDKAYYDQWMEEAKTKYDKLRFVFKKDFSEQLKKDFQINKIIFMSIIVVVTCVFFITINAVLVGIYETRRNEFLLYAKIGISRRRTKLKIIRELSLISLVGVVGGVLISMLTITLLNQFIYKPMGLHLYYFHPWSIYSFLICNALILFPSILLRLRSVRRAEKEME